MKKIISVLAIAAVSFAAFADAEFALNYRTQAALASRVFSGGAEDLGTDAKIGNYDALKNHTYLLSQQSYGGASDSVSASVAGDFCGATIRIDPEGTSGNLTINQYNGYVNIGKWTIAAGSWKDGQYIGDYQLKSDADACNLGGETFAAYKLGNMFIGASSLSVDDIANFAGGDKSSTAYVKWAGKVGKTFVQAFGSAIGINTAKWNDAGTIYTGFGAKVDVKGQNLRSQFVFKSSSNTGTNPKRAFALHVMPQGLGSTEMTIGGAIGLEGSNLTEANVDLRVRYSAGGFSFTTLNNISHITNANTLCTKGVNKEVGAWAVDGSGNFGTKGVKVNRGAATGQAFNTAMWNVFAIRQKITKTFFLTCQAGDMIYFNNMLNDKADWEGMDAFVCPGIQIFAGGKTSIMIGARYGVSNLFAQAYNPLEDKRVSVSKNYEIPTSLVIPCVMRIRF